MYLDTGTMIGIMIALITSILTIGYCMYIIKKQNEIIQMHQIASATRRRMERQIAMQTQTTNEYLKELAQFLTSDAWSEERIMELLSNVYLMGYAEGVDNK